MNSKFIDYKRFLAKRYNHLILYDCRNLDITTSTRVSTIDFRTFPTFPSVQKQIREDKLVKERDDKILLLIATYV